MRILLNLIVKFLEILKKLTFLYIFLIILIEKKSIANLSHSPPQSYPTLYGIIRTFVYVILRQILFALLNLPTYDALKVF